jgi:hypothetical protein
MDRVIKHKKVEQYRETIANGTDGQLKKLLERDPHTVEDLDYIRFLISKDKKFFEKNLQKPELDPFAKKILLENGQFCNVRPRADQRLFNGRNKSGKGLCWQNALEQSIDTGMKLFSGYAYRIPAKAFYWHVWNVDAQGYVYETTANWREHLIENVYFGLELDPYVSAKSLESEEADEVYSGLYLRWPHFKTLHGRLKHRHPDLTEKQIEIYFKHLYSTIKAEE